MKDRGFVKLQLKFLDSGYIAHVGWSAFGVYCILLSRIWRATNHWKKEVRDLIERGFIVATVGQKDIAETLGMSLRKVNGLVKKLVEEEWIEIKKSYGELPIYILGKIVEKEEVLFSEKCLETFEEDKQNLRELAQDLRNQNKNDTQNLHNLYADSAQLTNKNCTTSTQNLPKDIIVDNVDKVDNVYKHKKFQNDSFQLGSNSSNHLPPDQTSKNSIQSTSSDYESETQSEDIVNDKEIRDRLRNGKAVERRAKQKNYDARMNKKKKREKKTIKIFPKSEEVRPNGRSNVSTLFKYWKMVATDILGYQESAIVAWKGKNKKHAQGLIYQLGEKAEDYIQWACDNWKALKEEKRNYFSQDDALNIAILHGFLSSWAPRMGQSVAYSGRLKGEYNKNSPKGPSMGWTVEEGEKAEEMLAKSEERRKNV